ncbi:MAG: hypothetical protein AB7V45_12170 [Candidatus Krumholzibacteriia bacterium]
MVRKAQSILTDLSTADLKRLLVARERIDVLEQEKSRLVRELAKVEKELVGLMTEASGPETAPVRRGRKPGPRKVAKQGGAKKTARKAAPGDAPKKKAAAKKTGKKKAAKTKTAKTKSVKKAAPKKTVKKAPARAAGRQTLEEVVLAVIRRNGKPMAFKDLMAAIVKGKLFATKSKNFDNVLRRTLSTSEVVKRVDRGVYAAA